MKTIITLTILFTASLGFSQTAADIFKKTDFEYTYLGIDYSHAKFIGDFSHFAEWGEIGYVRLKEEYFDRWNNVVIREPDKYNLEEMLRKDYVGTDLSTIRKVNSETATENMEGRSSKPLAKEDIQGFIDKYTFKQKEGIGVLFVAEYLNKTLEEGCFHFVAINMKTGKILIHERFTEEAGGFGLRNYWMRPIYLMIDKIKAVHYGRWRKRYLN